jgi:hypothetical protein
VWGRYWAVGVASVVGTRKEAVEVESVVEVAVASVVEVVAVVGNGICGRNVLRQIEPTRPAGVNAELLPHPPNSGMVTSAKGDERTWRGHGRIDAFSPSTRPWN